MAGYERGENCHWCGAYVTHADAVKSGKHVFCKGGRCKMAHHRAYRKYLANAVTVRTSAHDQVSKPLGAKGNAKRKRK